MWLKFLSNCRIDYAMDRNFPEIILECLHVLAELNEDRDDLSKYRASYVSWNKSN
jgi:hypothetical protein